MVLKGKKTETTTTLKLLQGCRVVNGKNVETKVLKCLCALRACVLKPDLAVLDMSVEFVKTMIPI